MPNQRGTMDAKVEKSLSTGKLSTFRPVKPDIVSRPQNIKLPQRPVNSAKS